MNNEWMAEDSMARIRTIKPDFWKDEDIARLPPVVQLFFIALWNFADRKGRLEDRPERLKVEIFPYTKADIEKCLSLLASPKKSSGEPFIIRYEANGRKYIQIVNFEKHQRPHSTEQESIIPDPPNPIPLTSETAQHVGSTAQQPLSEGGTTVQETLENSQERKGMDKGKEGKGKKSAPTAPPSLEEVKTYFLTNGFDVLEAEAFFYHFESNGWLVSGKTPMKSWTASAQGWVRRSNKFGGRTRDFPTEKKAPRKYLSADEVIAKRKAAEDAGAVKA